MAYGVVTIPFSERSKNATRILAQLPDVPKFKREDNPKPRNNALYNHYFAWKRLLGTGKEWLTLLQDDIILAPNFAAEHLRLLNEHSEISKVMSFFSLAWARSNRAISEGKTYFKFKGFSDPCATLHNTVVKAMLGVFDDVLGPQPREYWQDFGYVKPRHIGWEPFWMKYCQDIEKASNPIYIVPDLVQHDVDNFDSVISNPNKGKGPGRISHTFQLRSSK
jgi:hypothetical protein